MRTLICPTCGCSLVRLGVTQDNATVYRFEGEERLFCCQECLDLFVSDPAKYLGETRDLVVCPTCLAEKPRQWAVMVKVANDEVWFCRCPYCREGTHSTASTPCSSPSKRNPAKRTSARFLGLLAIKGNAAYFEMEKLTELTHKLETLRPGKKQGFRSVRSRDWL